MEFNGVIMEGPDKGRVIHSSSPRYLIPVSEPISFAEPMTFSAQMKVRVYEWAQFQDYTGAVNRKFDGDVWGPNSNRYNWSKSDPYPAWRYVGEEIH